MNTTTTPETPPVEPGPLPAISFGGAGGSALRTLVRLAAKRRRLALATLAGVLLAGILYYILATPMYRAVATLEISREVVQVVEGEDQRNRQATIDQEFYETQYGLLRGRAIAGEVVKSLGLDNNPAYIAYAPQGVGANRPEARDQRTRKAVAKLMSSTQVVPGRLSRLVDIRVADRNPEMAAKIANAIAEAYMRQNLGKRVDRTSFARDFLEHRLAQVRSALEDSERRLVQYADVAQIITVPQSREENHAAQGTASQSLAGADLEAASRALGEARTARINAAANYAATAGGGGARTEILQNPATDALLVQRAGIASDIAQLSSSYGNDYPPLAAKRAAMAKLDQTIAGFQSRFTGAAKSDLAAASQREEQLSRQVDTMKAQMVDLSNRSIQYTILQREVDTNRTLYEGLLQQYKQTNVAADLSSNNVNFVLRAEVPEKPYSPDIVNVLLISLLAGVLLAILAVLTSEVFDARISTPDDFRERLNAPLLGIVPLVDDAPLDALVDPRSQITEAYSSAHANLRFVSPHGAPHVLALTSTRPGEGKSTTAIALATIFARRGDKVLVIDGDLRRPSLHRRLKVDNTSGLSNLLAGEPFSAQSVHDLGVFDLMTTGPLPPSPSDLLGSVRLSELFGLLRQRYDRVIVDAPPVLGLVDAPLIATACDGALFVVEAGGPRLGPIRRSVERIEELKGRIFGFIFTKYDLRSSIFSSYGAYDYYGYGYGRNADTES